MIKKSMCIIVAMEQNLVKTAHGVLMLALLEIL